MWGPDLTRKHDDRHVLSGQFLLAGAGRENLGAGGQSVTTLSNPGQRLGLREGDEIFEVNGMITSTEEVVRRYWTLRDVSLFSARVLRGGKDVILRGDEQARYTVRVKHPWPEHPAN